MIPIALSRDILAVRCIEDFLVVGVGNQLRLYRASNNKLLGIINTFHGDVIHNIVKSTEKLIVFGGRHLSIFKFQIKPEGIVIENENSHVFDDWIIAAEFFTENSKEIYILFSHNNLYLFNTSTRKSINIWCKEKCILYGGYLSRETSEEILIFSCTVFQEILMWKVNNTINYSSEVPVLHRLKGHKGVIFSVFYHPKTKLITSTSDDRTIRLWKVVENDVNSISNSMEWNNIEIRLLSTMYGHTARVWKSIIMENYIISIGEDSLICIWSETGVLRRKITAHGGAPVWSIDISPDRSTLITGGGDGGLNTWSLSNSSPILSHRFTYQKKTPKFVTYMHSGALAVFMDGGDLLYYNQTHQHSPPTTMIVLRRLSSYCLMHISPDRKKLAFASQDGHVIIFQEELTGEKNHPSLQEVLDQKIIDSKIFSLQWLSGASLLVCGPRGALKLLNFKGNHLEIQAEFTLPLSKECWTTSALICSSLLVCGDRTGNIIVYRVNPSPSKMPRQILQRIHGRLGVQSLGISGDKILSTGRDGILRYHRLLEDDSGEHLEPLHWKKMPMEWVSRSLRTDDDVYVLGFKEIEFMIYSTRLERLLLRMICGGGHRSWDCLFNDGEINFVCIKDKQVHTTENLSIKSSNSIIPGLHSKEIHSLGVLGTSSRHRVILTGSEDCSIRVSVLERRSRGFEIVPLDVYDGHISSIKTIEILDLNLNSCEETEILSRSLVFSGGGRAQLKVWEVRVDFTKEIITRDDVVGMQLTSFMLRGTDRDRRKFPNSGTSYFLDPETRFMDISAQFCRWDKNIVILFVACSDGFIRVIFYDVEKKIASLLVEISYYNRCVLKVHSFEIEGGMILVSMATDGFINLWDGDFIVRGALEDGTAGEGLEPFGRWRAHQSGINSYDFREDGTVFFIVSGGDDNKVSFSVFEVFGDCQKREVRTKGFWESSDTHSAQITGARFIPNDQLLTTAIDQRVVLYDYNYSNEKLSVAPIKIIQTFVSDLQGLTVCHNPENCDETLAFVYGQGVEVLLHEHKAYN